MNKGEFSNSSRVPEPGGVLWVGTHRTDGYGGTVAQVNREEESMTFHDWLSRQIRRQSPLGDLARDVAMDRTFPKDAAASREAVILYLIRCNACEGALLAAKRAWSSYRRALKREA